MSTATPPPPAVNYDESRIPPYTLPDPLLTTNGHPVTTPAQWPPRRHELLDLFATHVYGRSPPPPPALPADIIATDPRALGGHALRKIVALYPTGHRDGPRMEILLHIPAQRPGPVPLFFGFNFRGNQSIHPDPAIPISANWLRFRPSLELESIQTDTPEASRGSKASRWPMDTILSRGYALATCFYGDLEPDFPDGWKHGVRGALANKHPPTAPDAWGAIGAWAWGIRRAMDYFATDPDIDASRVAVLGHSRLGKTALWAAAQDERIALAISNNSGCGGAALSRRWYGETIERINTGFPHWFCANYKHYNNNESALPVDQHMLLSLIAPRPLYVASAVEDRWCDPKGEFLSALHADPVYRLLGHSGLDTTAMPPLNHPVGNRIGYHIRSGKHDVTPYDWDQFLNFADRNLRSKR